ncbi:uncharacterized protein LOC116301205 [Actinia tenebrosa]|uniref:Uncharacterized protein LOC116301205 n=1 Tax=Actinia tenebrosa TaxID=6105 RepID=A0A6P8IHE3_ACTTE|nr:uncharacterized protein LOC116301205 [Actinia tenebrosa]
MVTITIHRGELLQIKRIITKYKKTKYLKGSLYGLYTESYQPVVLIACGGDNKKKIDEYLWENHKLLPLGEWIVSNSKKAPEGSKETVIVEFDNQGEFVSAQFKGKVATLDILEGQSAFRDYNGLAKFFQDKTGVESSPIKVEEKREEISPSKNQLPASQSRSNKDHIINVESHSNDVSCYTRTSQWYNTDRDNFQNIFEFVRRRFADGGTVEMCRNTSTEDMTFKFNHCQHLWAIEFPAEFPRGVVTLKKLSDSANSKRAVSSQQTRAELSNMKNRLREEFINMCKCPECSNSNQESWV